jgi:hypothetical protein
MHWTKKVAKGNNYVFSSKRVIFLFLSIALHLIVLDHYEVALDSNHYCSSNALDKKVTNGNNYVINPNRVMVLDHCISFNCV